MWLDRCSIPYAASGYGVSYVDENGDQRCFFLIESGYNGSVQMVEAQPYEELLWSIPGG